MTVLARVSQRFMCPTCGEIWYPEDITESTVSASRKYCQSCVGGLDTAARRAKWFEEQDGRADRLLMLYLTNDTCGALHSTVDAAALLKWVQQTDPDGYEDVLFDYIFRTRDRKLDYWTWLLETN